MKHSLKLKSNPFKIKIWLEPKSTTYYTEQAYLESSIRVQTPKQLSVMFVFSFKNNLAQDRQNRNLDTKRTRRTER